MKRFFALLSALGLLLALAACGPAAQSPAPTDTTPPPTESMEPTPSPEENLPVETPEATPPQESLPPEETEEPAEPELPVSADYANEDLLSRPEDYDLLLLDDSEYRVDVAITATETVTDIQVVSIPMDDMGYRVDAVLGTLDAIAPGRPFVVAMAFPGDMPNTALVFTDSDGAVHYCAIAMSGKDGSLLLIPFEPVSD